MTLLFMLAGHEAERARADAIVALFLFTRRKGERWTTDAQEEGMSDSRQQVSDVPRIQYARARVRTCLQGLLSKLSLASRVP